jgi:hypothetical protein
MNTNENIPLGNTNNEYFCPKCSIELEKSTRETTFFYYFKCPNCNKVFQQKKAIDTQESIFLIGEQLQNIKFALYCIPIIVIIWFSISFIFTFVIR